MDRSRFGVRRACAVRPTGTALQAAATPPAVAPRLTLGAKLTVAVPLALRARWARSVPLTFSGLLTFVVLSTVAALLTGTARAAAPLGQAEESRALDPQEMAGPERYLIVAVDDSAVPAPPPVGGTPRGYDGASGYGPTWHARATLHALEAAYGLRAVNAWPIHPLRLHCAVLRIAEGADRGAVLAALAHDERVKLAQPLQTFATHTSSYNEAHASGYNDTLSSGYNDPYVGLQRGFEQMHVADAQAVSQGDGVRVAIIDTGVDTLHPDLRASVAGSANFVDGDLTRFRRDRHGTEIAGVIAAVANNHEGIVGVAPRARLLLYKACWQTHEDADPAVCNSFTLAQALVAALDAHAQIINLSLAGPPDPLLHDLIQEGLRRGVLIVGAAAAGAGAGTVTGADAGVSAAGVSIGVGAQPSQSPGLMHEPGVIEVASVGNYTAPSDSIHAPGREILTLLPGGHYDFASGDSIATAEVTGLVALLLAKQPRLESVAAQRLLRSSSAHRNLVGDAGETGESVDACVAMAALLARPLCGAR